jgi:hypothetical protein
MLIDISAHLRRLVLGGLPVLAVAGCQQPTGQTPGPPAPLVTTPRCEPRMILDDPARTGTSVDIGFDTNDARVSDLYESCLGAGDYCGRLCQEALTHAEVPVPTGFNLGGPQRCELRCDEQGRPVLRIRYSTFNAAPIGRRPEGFAGAPCTRPGTSLAAYFADCARLEGASVTAFEILARELELHRAPATLIDRARVAAQDERRHFALTSRLARRFGAPPVRFPRPPRPGLRTLAAMARENVVEGCVNETFAAAVALWQAATAADPAVRATLAPIAEDELRHAQLAWDVHAWADPCLTVAQRADLRQARAQAGRALQEQAAGPVDLELIARAGLPGPAAGERLAGQAQRLWA